MGLESFTNPDYLEVLSVDFLDHLLTGYVSAKLFFPERNKIKTFSRAFVAGFLPDIDFVLPFLNHRGPTHNGAAYVPPLAYSFLEYLFNGSWSRALGMTFFGTMGHLIADKSYHLDGKLEYLAFVGAIAVIQKYIKVEEIKVG